MRVGYARVSSADQDLAIQIQALEEYGCDKIYEEKRNGTTTLGREQLQECLDFVRDGDELVITRIDRICRNVLDLEIIVKGLQIKEFRGLQLNSP